MLARYPAVVFAPNGGATFVVHLDPSTASGLLPTPMPATGPDGRLALPWRWGGHRVDREARVVHFTFVNRLTDARWTADVPFECTVAAAAMPAPAAGGRPEQGSAQ